MLKDNNNWLLVLKNNTRRVFLAQGKEKVGLP
jgi:hypothetical protein